MAVPAKVTSRFEYEAPYVGHVGSKVRDVLLAFCDSRGFAYLGRQKALHSLWEKLEAGRYKTWDEIDDLFACTIIVPQVADEPAVLEYLERTFVRTEVRKRGTTLKDPSVYRFDATRFYGRLTELQATDSQSRVSQIVFEVQIRTAFEHAWSVTTHAFYKGDSVDWKRLRLAAQLKAAVEQLDGLVSTYDKTAADMPEHPWPETLAKKKLEDFFRVSISAGILPEDCEPRSWARFCDSLYNVIVSAQRRHVTPTQVVPIVEAAIGEIQSEFLSAEFVAPQSLSLMQLCLGILTTRKVLTEPIRNYTPPVSTELDSIYPAVSVLGTGFAC